MTNLAIPQASRLAQVTGFSDAQINLVRQTVVKSADNLEVAWLLYNAKLNDADPVLGEIYLIKYDKNSVGQIVPGIALFRKRADSTGEYAGSDRPEYEYDDDGDQERIKLGAPYLCRVTVYRMVAGQRCPFTGEVRWKEFYPGPGKQGEQWRKRPHNQMSVRAESHALRKAFPRHMQHRIEALPADWQDAALEAPVHDPELVKRNAAKYDRIFGDAAYTIDTDGSPADDEEPVEE